MLSDINIDNKSVKQCRKSDFCSNDTKICKNIIDILFVFIDNNIRKDKKMTGFTKSLVLSQLPGIRSGSKDYLNDMNDLDTKILLDNIQSQLNKR